jgi:hypothetical protein
MSAREWPFKLTDVRRAIQAVQEMRLPVSGVRIEPDGTIHIDTSPVPKPPTGGEVEIGRPNSFDQVLGS